MSEDSEVSEDVFQQNERVFVTDQAMGARCAVAADFDGDGRMDIVSASSDDNAVSWYRNLGPAVDSSDPNGIASGPPTFSIKRKINWASLGSRIVTVADIDGDGDVDVVGLSYYDSSLRWFENDGTGQFTEHLLSTAVNEGQGVTVADIDNDGDPDIITASSGDHTIAVFKNIDKGVFCEIKEIVDDDATGARTVVASDLNGDGWIDLASASKDDDTVAWYPNDGTGHFPTKIIISAGAESDGAYSLVAVDIDDDGDKDLVVASNGNDHVSLWRNDGNGIFNKTLIYDSADFVLSVTAVDFDRDGDIDVASASYFDGHINWYENVDGKGYQWQKHTVYVGIQGHYVSHADMDGDGDDDLIAVTHAENTVAIFLARTGCDLDFDGSGQDYTRRECCHMNSEWNGMACEPCQMGTYGINSGIDAKCIACPIDTCIIPGRNVMPATCTGITGCHKVIASVAACSCPTDTMKDSETDACKPCPDRTSRPISSLTRGPDTIGNYTAWKIQQEGRDICTIPVTSEYGYLYIIIGALAFVVLVGSFFLWWKHKALSKADSLWTIKHNEIEYDDPVIVLGKGSSGRVVKGSYRGTCVAVKSAISGKEVVAVKNPCASAEVVAVKSSISGAEVSCNVINSIPTNRGDEENLSDNRRTRDSVLFTIKTATKSFSTHNKQVHKFFLEEMRILSKLRHPCITVVMGAVLPSIGKPLLVMEYMELGSLRGLLSNDTFPVDAGLMLPLIRDILRGMHFLHAGGVIHGDLKCANILVDGNFRAKICDFGLSATRTAKSIRSMVGTPFWMSPELLGGGSISMESDVYAFGVTLWEVMTQKIPYEDHYLDFTADNILTMVREGELRPDCHEGLDRELVECMQECWAQQAEDRPTLQDLEMKLIPLCGQNFFTMMQTRSETKSKVTRRQTQLLQEVFPKHVATDLLAGKKVAPQHHECVTIYFSDIVGFTTISSTLSAAEVSDLLDRLYTVFDELAGKHEVFKLETIGDAWVGATNLEGQCQDDHSVRIARFSIDTVRAAQNTAIHPDMPEMGNVKIRVGFHCGSVVSSVVGTRNPRYCLFGDTMNIASRMESSSEELKIHCSEAAAQFARGQDDRLQFSYRGLIEVKGKSAMHTYWVDAVD